jgi:hypothetical protein
MKPTLTKCQTCDGSGYVRPAAGEEPPVPIDRQLTLLESQALANWLLWGKPCPVCGSSGKVSTATGAAEAKAGNGD